MKPFMTPELMPNGKKAFGYQLEGVDDSALGRLLKGRKLMAYALPEGHTLQEAWELSFVFDEFVLRFSSACTMATGWREVGSLNVSLTRCSNSTKAATALSEIAVLAIEVAATEKLIYEDQDVVVECGLVLHSCEGWEVVIAAGIPPGSVSVQAPFSLAQSFAPQFPLHMCRRENF